MRKFESELAEIKSRLNEMAVLTIEMVEQATTAVKERRPPGPRQRQIAQGRKNKTGRQPNRRPGQPDRERERRNWQRLQRAP